MAEVLVPTLLKAYGTRVQVEIPLLMPYLVVPILIMELPMPKVQMVVLSSVVVLNLPVWQLVGPARISMITQPQPTPSLPRQPPTTPLMER